MNGVKSRQMLSNLTSNADTNVKINVTILIVLFCSPRLFVRQLSKGQKYIHWIPWKCLVQTISNNRVNKKSVCRHVVHHYTVIRKSSTNKIVLVFVFNVLIIYLYKIHNSITPHIRSQIPSNSKIDVTKSQLYNLQCNTQIYGSSCVRLVHI